MLEPNDIPLSRYPQPLFKPPADIAALVVGLAWLAERRGTVTVELPISMELAEIVLSQTEYGQGVNATERSTRYSAEVDAWFAPHRDRALVRELDALPVDMLVYYAFRDQSAAWEFIDGQLQPSPIYSLGGFWSGDDPFGDRLELLQDFIITSDAQAFLDEHAEHYAGRVGDTHDLVIAGESNRQQQKPTQVRDLRGDSQFVACRWRLTVLRYFGQVLMLDFT